MPPGVLFVADARGPAAHVLSSNATDRHVASDIPLVGTQYCIEDASSTNVVVLDVIDNP